MADNVIADAGSGGATFAADDIGGVHYPRTKIVIGANNTNDGDVSTTNPLPVETNAAIDAAVGGTDKGFPMLAKHSAATARLATDTGDWDVPRLSEWGAILSEPEQHFVIDDMNNLAGFGGTWAAMDTDTTGVASSTKHVLGSASVEFDKVDGAANSGIGGVTKALTAINLDGASPHDILQCVVQIAAVDDIDDGTSYFFLRLGTNSTNYNEWRIPGTEFTAGEWEVVAMEVGDASFAGQGGTGIVWGVITYVAVGFQFDNPGDEELNINVDEISFHTNQHVNAAINAEITSNVSSANINVQKIAGSPTTKGAGNVGNGSQRIVLATDDINTAAAKVSLEIMDDWDETNRAKVNIIAGQVGIAGGTGTDGATVPRVTLATDIGLPAGAALIGDVGLSGARTAGGTTIFRSIDLDEGTLEVVKASAGQIYWIHATNQATAARYIKIYNATSGTIGTGTPVLTFLVPTQGDSKGAGFVLAVPNGIAFATGISIGASTGVADNDTGAPGANEVIVNLGFA